LDQHQNRFVKWSLLVFAYVSLALFVTYPLILHFGDYFIGGAEDGSLSIWSIWWMKFSLIDQGQGFFDCHYLFFPSGVDLTFNAMPKLLGTIGLFLQEFFSLAATYNLIIIFTFVASGLTAYWLAYRLLGQTLPAFMTGAFFAFSPFRLSQISHVHILATMLIPVYIALIMMMRESFNDKMRRSWLYSCLAGITLALIAYDTEHYAILLGIFSGIFLLFYFPRRGNRHERKQWLALVSGMSVILAVAAFLFLPVLVAAIRGAGEDVGMLTVNIKNASALSSDPVSFFIPRGGPDLVSGPFKFITDRASRFAENSYLDLIIMALALIGAWYYRKVREVRLWVITTMIFAILSLGPIVKIFDNYTHIPLPYLAIHELPFLNAIRAPSRYVSIATLSLALLAGYGATVIFNKLRGSLYPQAAITISATLIMSAFFLETRPQTSMVSLDAPPVMNEIAASDLSGSVLTLPLGWETTSGGKSGQVAAFTQLDQIFNHRPLIGGIVSRAPSDLVSGMADEPVLDYLSDPSSSPTTEDVNPGTIVEVLNRFQIAFIVVHKLYPQQIYGEDINRYSTDISPTELDNVERYVTRYLGMEKIEDTDELIVYRRGSQP